MTTYGRFLKNYVRYYLLCCIFPDKTYDPSRFQILLDKFLNEVTEALLFFGNDDSYVWGRSYTGKELVHNIQEDHYRYRACFGAFHVKYFALALIVIRTFFFTLILVYVFVGSSDSIVRLSAVFSFCVATASNFILIAGMRYKRNNLVLPYLLIAVLFVIYLILQLFINLLDSANTKDTLRMSSLLRNVSVLAVLYFEIYTALIVWRVFVYVCDTRMDDEIKVLERNDNKGCAWNDNCKVCNITIKGDQIKSNNKKKSPQRVNLNGKLVNEESEDEMFG